MRKFLASSTRTSALTERLASPFLRGKVSQDTAKSTAHGGRRDAGEAPMTDRDYADAAIRFCRTLW